MSGAAPKIMRLGVAVGLSLTIIGLCASLRDFPRLGSVVTFVGVLTVLCTPLTSLVALVVENARRNPKLSILAMITILAMVLSIAVSLPR